MPASEEQIASINAAWDYVINTLNSMVSESESLNSTPKEEFSIALKCIQSNGMAYPLVEWFLHTFESYIRADLVPKFWECFNKTYMDQFWKFPKALDVCFKRLQKFNPIIEEFQSLFVGLAESIDSFPRRKQIRLRCLMRKSIKDNIFETVRVLLLSKWPVHFRTILVEYYSKVFKLFEQNDKSNSAANISNNSCSVCDMEVPSCSCAEYLETFQVTNKQLLELQLLEHIVGDVPINVAQDHVEKHIFEACKGSFEVSYLEPLKNWICNVAVNWLSNVYLAEENDQYKSTLMEGYKERLLHTMYEAYAKVRLDQMFNVIIEFPDSQAVLEDLEECITIAGLRPILITSIRDMMEKRLLHPGVNTADILTAYISSIKALRVLDSSGVVLQLVCEPVCKYLRSREDTVRCIVSSLTDDSCEELAGELMKASPLVLEDSYISDEENDDWETWTPDPVDADPNKATKGQRSSDIISMLVNIYGSKELFVNEYRTLLADRLLSTFSYNTEKEIRYLELLKLRFGESQLHFCEVMLKDISDSKRISTYLASDFEEKDFPVSAMILSAQFWPPFKEEKLRLPESIWSHLQKYTLAFEMFKGNRSLAWKPHLGIVNLEIEFDEGTKLEFFVSPVHATILWYFQEKPQWTISELRSVTQIQASVLRRKITFWQSHGILREEDTDVFVLIEEQKGSNQESMVMMEEEAESVTASSQDQREEELQTFWSFIVGMLTNMESLPLERIHSMLRMFAMQGPSTNEFTIQGMKQFLDKKVRERKLLYSGGLYRLPKFDS